MALVGGMPGMLVPEGVGPGLVAWFAVVALLAGGVGRGLQLLRRLEAERRRSGESLRILADAMPQIVWTARPNGVIDYINRMGVEYTGLEREPSSTGGWVLPVYPDDLERRAEAWRKAVREVRGYEIEYRIRRASDGSYRWHLARAEPMRDEGGRVVRWFGTCTDIHDQKMAGERRYRSLVEATTAVVWDTPASGEFESDQPAWSAFTGQGFGELKGWGWLDAIHPDDRPETIRVWSEAVARRSIYVVEHRLRRHDGEYRHMMVRAVPILSEDGSIHEWIGVHTDVDAQRKAEVALREAKEAAESASRSKGEFLANMSHEIRTPMNGVLGMTELALRTELSPRQREYLGLVKSSADALLTVINDILDFSKIEAGKLTLDPVPFRIRDAVADTLRPLAIRANDKGLELAFRIPPGVPDSVVGDQGRIRQILVNLVGNAIKFTERGEVLVSVEVVEGGALEFAVSDTGIGIPEAKRAAIFEPFEQADGSTTRRYGGTGLGLTISQRLVELMGGRIRVEDNPGGGSVFRFTARLDTDPESRPAPYPADPGRLDGLRVLIVDDNKTNRLILEEILAQWGCRPHAVPGGVEALAALAEAVEAGEPFELALLDRMMPDMDGSELAGRIHRDPTFAGPTMLMLTSGGEDESARSRELGLAACLSKPIRHSELFEALLMALEPVEGARIACPPGLAETVTTTAGRRLQILLVDDHPINQKVASRLLEDQGHRVTIAGDGRAAVDAASAAEFDAILMDVQMPVMDGFEATAAIRRREEGSGRHTPIIALTAHAMAGDRERCLGAGFDDYLSKPIQANLLCQALDRLGGPKSGTRPDAGEAGGGLEGHPPFDRRTALENLGGDGALLDEVVALFLDDSPRLLGSIRLAVDAGDATTLGRLAHTLSGVASNIAASEVVAPARKLQAMAKSGDLAGARDLEAELARAVERLREVVGASRDGTP